MIRCLVLTVGEYQKSNGITWALSEGQNILGTHSNWMSRRWVSGQWWRRDAGEKVNSFPSTEIGKVGDSQARLFYWSDKHIDFSTVNTSKQHSLPFMEKLWKILRGEIYKFISYKFKVFFLFKKKLPIAVIDVYHTTKFSIWGKARIKTSPEAQWSMAI